MKHQYCSNIGFTLEILEENDKILHPKITSVLAKCKHQTIAAIRNSNIGRSGEDMIRSSCSRYKDDTNDIGAISFCY